MSPSVLVNNTPYAVATAILMDAAGRETLVVAVKATFAWQRDHSLTLLPEAPAVVTADVYGGPPDASGLAWANELTLPKPRVDVLLSGDIVLAAAVDQLDCTLTVAGRLSKTVRVFGDRHWRLSAVSSVVPSSSKPFTRMPMTWERSFGGQDPDDPGAVDLRNPVGRGVRKQVSALEGQPVPNFEDPRAPIKDPLKGPVPIGLGPVARILAVFMLCFRFGRFQCATQRRFVLCGSFEAFELEFKSFASAPPNRAGVGNCSFDSVRTSGRRLPVLWWIGRQGRRVTSNVGGGGCRWIQCTGGLASAEPQARRTSSGPAC
jgi:hypothetical protein